MISMDASIWGRDFTIEILFDRFEGEDILASQGEAFVAILNSWSEIEDSRQQIEQYCLERDGAAIGSGSIDNIFKYVIPETIYIKRSQTNREVALLCSYRFDVEHGLAALFSDEQLVSVGPQDIVL